MKLVICLIPLVLISAISVAGQAQDDPGQQRPRAGRRGGVLQDMAVTRVEPVYPPLAKAARVSGQVVVEVTVDEKGDVLSARAVSGHALLKDSAISAARGWKFQPTTLSGTPVKVIGSITFNFTLPVTPDPLAELEKSVKRSPNSAQTHFELGSAYLKHSRYEQASRELKESIRIKPDFSEAHCKLGMSYRELGRYEEAAAALRRAISLNPEYAEAILESAMIAALTEHYVEAIGGFKRALELEPKSAEAHFCLGITYSAMGRPEDGIKSMKEGLAIDPSNAQWHFELGRIYAGMGDKKSAMDEYATLQKLDPNLAETFLKEIKK